MRRRVGTSLYAGFLFVVLGAITWSTGQPFVFPSLGPTAFLLAFDRRIDRSRAAKVIAAHAIGVAAGLAAWSLIAAGVSMTATPPAFSPEGFRLAASATVSVMATTWAMIATNTVHAPACATTLIVSLGLLSTPLQAAVIVGGVVVLVGVHALVIRAFKRLVGDSHPAYRE